LPDGAYVPPGRIYTAADAQVDFMLSGHLPAGSRLLVLSPDDRWKEMVQARNKSLYDSWEVVEAMDVPTAKRWSQEGVRVRVSQGGEAVDATRDAQGLVEPEGTPMAVVFFHDGVVSNEWSYELFHALTILLHFGADFIYTAEDSCNPSTDARYPTQTFPMPGPGMFVDMLKKSMPPGSEGRTYCCGKGGNVGRKFIIDRAIQMLGEQGHSGQRDQIMIIGDRFDTDIRAGVLAGIKSCLLESGSHTLEMADEFPTDIPSYTASSIAALTPRRDRWLELSLELIAARRDGQTAEAGTTGDAISEMDQRVREIWGKGGGKESKGTEAQERQASVLGGGFSM